ncbi:MAG: hypothetical protein EZS28_008692 [Streblomastix strix]|uniref:Uncharacterized protein n=1 Tax=Streblomastix strix TaxID=222440 RepID=A0A5J4WLS9_9EUKA|nr:MAG: hypothetical protein EZS28_008692 [Streblomastix strix]
MKRLKSSQLWWLHQSKTIATAEQASKAVHCIMILAGFDNKYSVTSIRSASITKAIAQKRDLEAFNDMSHKTNVAPDEVDAQISSKLASYQPMESRAQPFPPFPSTTNNIIIILHQPGFPPQ